MKISGATLLCLAYLAGLLSTMVVGVPNQVLSWQVCALLMVGCLGLGAIAAFIVPRWWRIGPTKRLWLVAGIVAAVAVVYCQIRLPQPESKDISQQLQGDGAVQQLVTIQGKVASQPTLTRTQRLRFWLKAEQFNEMTAKEGVNYSVQPVTGKVYVTIPLLKGTGLYPGQQVKVIGNLYQPQTALNPGGFDFRAYLASEGAFAALKGINVIPETESQPPWGWWRVRRRIIRAQLRWLGSPAGQVVSSMVLGRRAVDLPYNIRDDFINAGLAHVLAASGFHISLLLGVVLALSRSFPAQGKLYLGSFTLVVYVCLTGFSPSVLRAALMGLGALVALVTERKVKPLGSLLLAAIILLLINPLWLWDLGFQLSFLATLGLIVTVPGISKKLDWLPSAIASVIAIPIAATIWTLPLLIHNFHILAPYSILLNILATPVVAIVSLGGMLSALAALIWTPIGSAIAWLLYYPTQALINLVHLVNQLPGNSLAVGTIGAVPMLAIYGIIVLICLNRRAQRWWLLGIVTLLLVVTPFVYHQSQQQQVTILATNQEPVIVIQDQGKAILVNSGAANNAQFAILPFLRQQGINRLDWAVDLADAKTHTEGWQPILTALPIQTFLTSSTHQETITAQTNISQYQPLELGSTLNSGSLTLQLISSDPLTLVLQINQENWLLFAHNQPQTANQQAILDYFQQNPQLRPQVAIFSGENVALDWLQALNPEVAIISESEPNLKIGQTLNKLTTKLYKTNRDGAIQWTPEEGFRTTLEAVDTEI